MGSPHMLVLLDKPAYRGCFVVPISWCRMTIQQHISVDFSRGLSSQCVELMDPDLVSACRVSVETNAMYDAICKYLIRDQKLTNS